jgi:hypothetical protein
VSKTWQTYLSSSPQLWTVLNLDHGRTSMQKRIPATVVKNCIRKSRYTLKEANLGCFAHRPTLIAMANCCKQLTSLKTSSRSTMGGDTALNMLKFCKNLTRLSIGFPLSRKYIHKIMDGGGRLTDLHVSWLYEKSPVRLFDRDMNLPMLTHFRCDAIHYPGWNFGVQPEPIRMERVSATSKMHLHS